MIELSTWTFALLAFYATIGGFVVGKQLVDIVIGYINVKKAQKNKDQYDWVIKELQGLRQQMENILNK